MNIDEELRFEPFWEGKIVIGASKDSPIASQKRIEAQDLLNYDFIYYEEDYVQEFIRNFNDKIGSLQTVFTSNNAIEILYALEEGIAITCAYDFTFVNSPYVSNSRLVTLEIDNFDRK